MLSDFENSFKTDSPLDGVNLVNAFVGRFGWGFSRFYYAIPC